MATEQFEVGLFSRSPRGVRLIGRTDDRAAVQFIRTRIDNPETTGPRGEGRADDEIEREYEGELTPLREILPPIIEALGRALTPARRDGDR